jgi:hypothetical protein
MPAAQEAQSVPDEEQSITKRYIFKGRHEFLSMAAATRVYDTHETGSCA